MGSARANAEFRESFGAVLHPLDGAASDALGRERFSLIVGPAALQRLGDDLESAVDVVVHLVHLIFEAESMSASSVGSVSGADSGWIAQGYLARRTGKRVGRTPTRRLHRAATGRCARLDIAFEQVAEFSGILPDLAGFEAARDSIDTIAQKIAAAVLPG